MSERAPQLLFDDGSRAIQQTTALGDTNISQSKGSARGSIPVFKYYEIDRIAAEIVQVLDRKKRVTSTPSEEKEDGHDSNPWFARVALQFPDELLYDAPDVCWEIEDVLNRIANQETGTREERQQQALVFCLGDTTFGPCCPDEVAALHLNADVLVHYGHACLSHPSLSLPVLYGFGVTDHWDTQTCVDTILEKSKAEGVRRLLLLYQVRYQHAMEDLQTQLSERGDIFLVTGQVQHESLERLLSQNTGAPRSETCCGGTSGCSASETKNRQPKAETTDDASEINSTNPSAEIEASTTFLLGGLEVPKNLDFSSFTLVFIGDDPGNGNDKGEGQRQYMNTILWYVSAKSKPSAMWVYSPLTGTLKASTPPGIQRQLNRRFFLIQKARDASVFGILIGTLSQRYFRSVVATLRDVIDKAGRSSYTFAMGKVNQAKLANFAEIQCFVMVACAETSWLDETEQREMHVPIITPLELHMALGEGGPEVQWGECDYSLDYSDFLAKYEQNGDAQQVANNSEVELETHSDDDEDAPYFSMITGKYETSKKSTAPEAIDLAALPGKGQLTTYKSEAAQFLKNREYKGLETKIGETEVSVAVPGQDGIASRYNTDLKSG